MRVLWVGDAVVSSGFAKCSHAVCDELHNAGHDVSVLGINYYGDEHDYPYTIYPCRQPLDGGHDSFGVSRLPILIDRLSPDIVVILQDPWNIRAYLDTIADYIPTREDFSIPPIVGWIAVDGKNQRGRELNRLSHVVVWTEFAQRELALGGYTGETAIVPLGVDTDMFHPRDRVLARTNNVFYPGPMRADDFIVGVVGRNQLRKRLDLTIEYFAEWVHSRAIPNAYLYLHVGPTGDVGYDIRSLVVHYNLQGRVILNTPELGVGSPESSMSELYSSFDVYLTTSQGEGWGLPALEAMACGVPVIAPDWSGLASWARGVATLVPCTSHAMTAPTNGLLHTIGGIADKRLTVDALDRFYTNRCRNLPFVYAEEEDAISRGLELAKCLSWSSTGVAFRETLEGIYQRGSSRVADVDLCETVDALVESTV